ncbi:MAG: flagellar hook-length control protein FliK, partial [Planctomycetaceae bacterium]
MHIQEDRSTASPSGETKFASRDRTPGFLKQGSEASFDLFAEIFQAIAAAPVPNHDSDVPSSDSEASQSVDASRSAGEADGERDDDAAQDEPTADSVAPYDLLVPLQPVVSDQPATVPDADSVAIEAPASAEESPAIAAADLPTQPSADVNASLPGGEITQADQPPLDAEPLPAIAMAPATEAESSAFEEGQSSESEIVVSDLSSRRINSAKPATEDLQQTAPETELPSSSLEMTEPNENAANAEALPSVDRSDAARDQGDRRQRRSNADSRRDQPGQAAALQDRQEDLAQRSAASMSSDARVSASEPGAAAGQSQTLQSDAAASAAAATPANTAAGLPSAPATVQAPIAGGAVGGGGSSAVGGLVPAQPGSQPGGQPGSATPTDSSRQSQVADRARLVHRIAKAFQRIGVDGGQVRLKMHPEELGGVQLSMQISGKKVTATVTADGESARQLLQDHLPELRQRLESLGLTVERLDDTSRTEGGEMGMASHQ